MIPYLKTIYSFSLKVIEEANKDNILSLGAAIAYFTIFSFGPVIVITIALSSIFLGEEAIILLVALVVNTIVNAFGQQLLLMLPDIAELVLRLFNILSSLIIPSLLFVLLFKGLPDAKVKWRDVWIGAIFTGVLFTIGKNFIGFYIGNSSISTTFGAAGSLAALLVWAYYTSQILLLGAEFTYVYAKRYEPKIEASEHGVKVK